MRVCLALLLIAVSTTSQAHHSSAGYEPKQISIEGVVTRYEWANPHVYIYLQQKTGSGETIEWEIEGGPPSIMRRMGWSKETLRPGDSITVRGNPARKASRNSFFPMVIKRGEQTLYDMMGAMTKFARADALPAVAAKSLEGIWTTRAALKVIVQHANPNLSKLTPEGVAAVKRFDERVVHPGINCIPFTAPQSMITPDLKRIAMRDGQVRIESEFDGAQRTVHMNIDTHEGARPSIQGHSIGKWEGRSLVIDTTHFALNAVGNALKLPSGSRKHLRERLTPNADGSRVNYQFELSDPDYLAVPLTGEVEWIYTPAEKFAPEKCSLESARRFTEE